MGNQDRVDRRPRRDPLNIRRRFRLLAAGVVAAAACGSTVQAQSNDYSVAGHRSNAPDPILIAPIYEGGVRKNRSISIPMNLRLGPARRLTAGYTASNSYSNPSLVVCADRSCELQYQSDHTGNLLFVSFSQPLLSAFELGLSVGTYQMNNIPDVALVHQLAGDDALRSFHENLLSENSLPGLSNAPDGRQIFTMTDVGDRRLTLEPAHHYAIPLRVDLTRYFDIRETERARMSLNAGMHLSYPLEGDVSSQVGATAFSRGADFGVSANFIHSRKVTPNLASTFHVQVARFRNNIHVVNPNSPLHGDDKMRSQYALTYGLRFGGSFNGSAPCSIGISQVSTSAHYDKQKHWTWDPQVREGGDNLRGALLAANDYGVLSFACEYRNRAFQVSLVEDIAGLSQIFDDDGSGTSYDPDFAVSVSVTWILGSRNDRQ